MNRQGYIRIMVALSNLIYVIMIEAGRTPVASAKRVVDAFFQAVTGKKLDDSQ